MQIALGMYFRFMRISKRPGAAVGGSMVADTVHGVDRLFTLAASVRVDVIWTSRANRPVV
jgi:hypothetical protein